MSPELKKDSLPHDKMEKFVREGGRVVHDSDHHRHDKIAEKYTIENPDDAGFINDFGPEISVTGESHHLQLEGDEKERQITIRIVEDITGKPTFDWESYDD